MARIGVALVLAFLTAHAAFGCSVPTFRFALEQWPASKYELILFHQGDLSTADRKVLNDLRERARSANLIVKTADLATPIDDRIRAIWDRETTGGLPRLVLRYPDSGPKVASAWSGALDADQFVALLESPARQSIFDRLTSGWAAVAVLLQSGDAKADEEARELLKRELPRIAGKIELPARTEEGPQIQSALPLRVGFPVIEVSRTDAEAAFVRLLLGSEDGLYNVRGPIVFPVFGRGRALCALHGNDLKSAEALHQSLVYLCRACSCDVKELNPGLDLLMSGNWDVIFNAEVGPAPRMLPITPLPSAEQRTFNSSGIAVAELRSAPPAGYAAVEVGGESASGRRPWLRYGTVAAGILVVVTGIWALRGRRTNPNEGN
jgi:hypothetical protein